MKNSPLREALVLSLTVLCSGCQLFSSNEEVPQAESVVADPQVLSLGKATSHVARQMSSEETKSPNPPESQSPVRPVVHQVEQLVNPPSVEELPAPEAPEAQPETIEQALSRKLPETIYPIDLATTLRLAGANHWQVQIATERVQQSEHRLTAAQAQWLPSLRLGASYASHTGAISEVDGTQLGASTGALFFGGGAQVGRTPAIAGGANSPARLAAELALADVVFNPLVAQERLDAAEANRTATFQTSLLDASLAYLRLLYAQGAVAAAQQAVHDTQSLHSAEPTEQLQVSNRLHAHLQQVFRFQQQVATFSAQLGTLLQMKPEVLLVSVDEQPLLLEVVKEEEKLADLLAQARAARPEIAHKRALVQATRQKQWQEAWRPWLPKVQFGYSTGEFSSGTRSDLGKAASRTDFDAQAVWEIRGLGLGTRASQLQAASENRAQEIEYHQAIREIEEQVVVAFHQVRHMRQQRAASEQRLQAAHRFWLQVRPEEQAKKNADSDIKQSLLAIDQLFDARLEYLQTLTDWNAAQMLLLHSVGQPPAVSPAKN